MTEQEAIKVFNTVLLLGKCELPADEANEAINLSIKALEEIQKYRSIGTVEECRDAIEKQIPKKPINCKMSKIKTAVGWCCPSCGNGLYWDTDYGQQKFIHCTECGQKLDWNK